MDVDVLTDVEIDRPRSEVAEYASNPDNATMWHENITKVDWKSPRPLEVGSRVAFEAQFMGQTLEYTYEITEYVPGESLVMSAASGPFPMETGYTFSDAPSGATRMELRNRAARPSDGKRDQGSQPQGPGSPEGNPRGRHRLEADRSRSRLVPSAG